MEVLTREQLVEAAAVVEDLQKSVSSKKYQHEGEHSFEDVLKRVCREYKKHSAKYVGAGFYADEAIEELIMSGKFIPAGSILSGLGNPSKCSLSNCYVTPIKRDSIEDIFENLKQCARTYSYRGGTGVDVTVLRPQGHPVNNSARSSSGAVSFMPLLSEVTNAIGQCVGKGELVLTPYGTKQIGDIKPGDLVWTHKGFKEVVNWIDSGVKDTVVITTDRGFSVQLTPDHTVAAIASGELKEIKVADCVEGDEILLSMATSGVFPISEYCRMVAPEYEVSPHNGSNRLITDVKYPEVFDEKLAWLAGYIYGNGSFSGEHDYLSIAVLQSRPEIQDRLVGCVEDLFGITAAVAPGDGAVNTVDVFKKLVPLFFTVNGLRKDKSQCISAPDIVLKSSPKVQHAFIAGFFDADGNVSNSKAGYRFDTTSYEFAEYLRCALLTFGVCTKTHLTPLDLRRNTVVYRVSVLGTQSKRSFMDTVGVYSLKAQAEAIAGSKDHTMTPYYAKDFGIKYNNYNYVPSGTRLSLSVYERLRESDYQDMPYPLVSDKIRSITPAGRAEVCDITLSDVNNFWCNGIYIHNCGRRGALLISIDIRHPDAMRFIWCKSDPEKVFGKDVLTGKVPDIFGANISLKLTDAFMSAACNNEEWEFYFPDRAADPELYDNHWNGDYEAWEAIGGQFVTYETLPAAEILKDIAKAAHATGDPGVLYIDTVIRNTPGASVHPSLKPVSTNPCFSGDMRLLTSRGFVKFKDLANKPVEVITPAGKVSDGAVWSNGIKEVVRVTYTYAKKRRSIVCTPDHVFMLWGGEECQAKDLLGASIAYRESEFGVFPAKVVSVEPAGDVEVFDFSEPLYHWGVVENVVVHNCGEQPIGPYNNCLLGALVFSKYVGNPFKEGAVFNYEAFEEDTKKAVQFMNVMSDINQGLHPLSEQREADAFGKRIGIEFTALGDTLAMLGYTYGGDAALEFVESVLWGKANAEIRMSADIAMALGPCPAFRDKEAREAFLNNDYIKDLRLHSDTEAQIRSYGLANTAFNTVGPTGSISIMSNNCTSGIEPLFMFSYTRQTRLDPDRMFHMMHKPAVDFLIENWGSNFEKKTPEEIKDILGYVEAWEVPWEKRIAMQAVAQRHTDSSISSTVNLPNDVTVSVVEEIYKQAWTEGLKGITIFRDGCKTGVLTATKKEDKPEAIPAPESAPGVVVKELLDEEKAVRFRVHWKGSKIYVIVTLDEDDQPLEVFAKLPREAGVNGNGLYSEEHFQEKYSLWETVTRLISLLLRSGMPLEKILNQLERSSYSVVDAAAILIRILRKFMPNELEDVEDEEIVAKGLGEVCKECGQAAYVRENGCGSCRNCGYTSCG